MPVPSVHCEAKKVAYRQTKDGLVVSFVIHPNDMPDALAVAPLGTRYMLAMAAIGDDEKPVELPPASQHPDTGWRSGSIKDEPSAASQRGKERYRDAPPMEQALIRAARLPDDLRFQQWVADETHVPTSKDNAIAYVQARCCDGGSRRSITTNSAHYRRFLEMETEFKRATGQMAEVR